MADFFCMFYLQMPSVNPDPSDKDSKPHLSKLIQQAGKAATTSYLAVVQWKKVYRAFDQEEGIEVAWNQVKLRNFTNDPYMIDRLTPRSGCWEP